MNLSVKHLRITFIVTICLQGAAFSMNMNEPSDTQKTASIARKDSLTPFSETDIYGKTDEITEENDTRRQPKAEENTQAIIDNYTSQLLKLIDIESLITQKKLDLDKENIEKINLFFSNAAANLNQTLFAQFMYPIWQMIKYNRTMINSILKIAVAKNNALILKSYWYFHNTEIKNK